MHQRNRRSRNGLRSPANITSRRPALKGPPILLPVSVPAKMTRPLFWTELQGYAKPPPKTGDTRSRKLGRPTVPRLRCKDNPSGPAR